MGEVEIKTRNYMKLNDHKVEKCIECLVQCDKVEEVAEVEEVEEVGEVEEKKTSIEAE